MRALRDAVAGGREGQAYLFSGPRGTGKTSSARILAKVLNCDRPVDGEPCCECASCLAVERGTSYDVHELDAASNNGVDAMRDLIEKASLGTPGRHKVYILDEVHMLSKAAEAALLKTLEEPPPHVVFVLATTDPQKVSDTIRSRTQHLRFHLLPPDTLAEHVRWVVADAGLDLDDAAIDAAIAQGGGSARDTLSALELIANAGGDAGRRAVVRRVRRGADRPRPGPGARPRWPTPSTPATSRGRSPRSSCRHLRNGFLVADGARAGPAARGQRGRRARRPGPARSGRRRSCGRIERLGEILVELRHAPDPRVLVEVALVQLTDARRRRPTTTSARSPPGVAKLEQAVAERRPAAAPAAPVDPATGRAAARRPGPRVPTARRDAPPPADRRAPTRRRRVAPARPPATRRRRRRRWTTFATRVGASTVRPDAEGHRAGAVHAASTSSPSSGDDASRWPRRTTPTATSASSTAAPSSRRGRRPPAARSRVELGRRHARRRPVRRRRRPHPAAEPDAEAIDLDDLVDAPPGSGPDGARPARPGVPRRRADRGTRLRWRAPTRRRSRR